MPLNGCRGSKFLWEKSKYCKITTKLHLVHQFLKRRNGSFKKRKLRGFPEAKVRFFSQSSENSRYCLNLTIHPGITSHSFSPYQSNSFPEWAASERFWMHPEARTFELDPNDVLFLKKYAIFRQDQEFYPYTSILFSRFARLTTFSSLWDKLIEAVIILEMLLLSGFKYKCLRLRKRISHILGEGDAEQTLLAELVRQIYQMRNEIVHAGGESLLVLLRVFPIKRIDEFLYQLVRCILLRFLQDDGTKFWFPQKEGLRETMREIMRGIARDIPICSYYTKGLNVFRQIIQQAGKIGS